MITIETAKRMSQAELSYAAKDLREVIAIQERTAREFGAHHVPKLGQYWDELHAVAGEVHRRKQ